MGTSNRVQSILFNTVSVMPILLNFALILNSWIVQDNVSSSSVKVLEKVDLDGGFTGGRDFTFRIAEPSKMQCLL